MKYKVMWEIGAEGEEPLDAVLERDRLLQVEKIWESVEIYLTKWQANETDAYGAEDCPCCQEWLGGECEGCPISEHVDGVFCQKTPYEELSDSLDSRPQVTVPTPVIMKLVEDEYRFLVEVAMSVSHQYQNEEGK